MSTNVKKTTAKTPPTSRSRNESIFVLLPLIAVVMILPLIVKMRTYNTGLSVFDWFSSEDSYFDLFLYYKQWFFVTFSAIALTVICFKAFVDKKSIKFAPVFIPLGVYAALALLSTIVSKYRTFAVSGIFEQFENIFCLLGYAIVVYYSFLMIRQENEIQLMIDALAIGALILGTIGAFQAFGYDLFNANFGRKMIADQYTDPSSLSIVFGEGRTYATLYNPNYVGVYTSFIIPMFSVLLIYAKKIYQYILYSLVLLVSLISLFGSQSKAGFISILVSALFVIVLLRKTLLKKWMIIIPLVLIMVGTFFYINKRNNNAYLNSMKYAFQINKAEAPALTGIVPMEDGVHVTYLGNEFTAFLSMTDNAYIPFALDSTSAPIACILGEDGYTYTLTDERFSGIQLFPIQFEDIIGIGLRILGTDWYFTNFTETGTYQYINRYGRLSSIETPKTFAPLNGYELFASRRGYIWSRTIPLLKRYSILGSGADTFAIAFPQHDYVGFYNYGYWAELITKPHCMYLQMAVQTGVLSLIAFLVFYLMYFFDSLRLYIKVQKASPIAHIGIAIFVGSISYMVSAISNDSSISVAPVFWVMIGVGITVNHMLKKAER